MTPFIGDYLLRYHDPKYHRDLKPFGVLCHSWKDGKPEPEQWILMKSFDTQEKATQSAQDRQRTMPSYRVSFDAGKTYETRLMQYAAARLVLPTP